MGQNYYIDLVSSYTRTQEKAQMALAITRYPQSGDSECYVKKFKISGDRLYLMFLIFLRLQNEFLLPYI